LTWLTCVTVPSTSKERLQGGAAVRAVEVKVSDAPTLPPERFQEILAVREHHGHAGERYVRHLLEAGFADAGDDRLRQGLEACTKALCGPDTEPQEGRAARLYAVLQLAGELAQEAGLLPGDYDVAALIRRLWQQRCG
jgi:hypothetical protein